MKDPASLLPPSLRPVATNPSSVVVTLGWGKGCACCASMLSCGQQKAEFFTA